MKKVPPPSVIWITALRRITALGNVSTLIPLNASSARMRYTNHTQLSNRALELQPHKPPPFIGGKEGESRSDDEDKTFGTEYVIEKDRVKYELFSEISGPQFNPNSVMSEWEDPTKTSKKLSVVFWPPSGVNF